MTAAVPTPVARVDVDELAARRQAAGRYVRSHHGFRVDSVPPRPTGCEHDRPRAAPAPEAQGRGAREAAQRPTLGNAGVTSSTAGQPSVLPPPLQPDEADVRWAVHRQMWNASPLKAVRSCRRYAHDPDAETVPLRFSPTDDGGISVGVGGLKTCAYWHSCMTCGAKIAVGRADELGHVFNTWREAGGYVVVGTFSGRHFLGQSLRQLVEAFRDAWGGVTSGRPWKEDLAALDVAVFDAHEDERFELEAMLEEDPTGPGADVLRKRLRSLRRTNGVIRAFETTVGDEHGWHPHFHVFFLVNRKLTREEARAALLPAWDRWCAGLAKHGMTAVAEVNGESAGFDVTVMDDADSGTLARYPFKLALEAVGGVFKRGRTTDADGRVVGKRHRTPFEVMEHYAVAVAEGAADDDLAVADLALIREWSTTARDMRFQQCPLPPGMRAVFAQLAERFGVPGPLLEPEKTEEELAEAEAEGTETAGDIGRKAWENVVAYELDTLRAAGRDAGLTGVVEWFDRRGLRFELTATGVNRVMHELEHPPPRMLVPTPAPRRPQEA